MAKADDDLPTQPRQSGLAVVFGVSGTGKTMLGQALAAALNRTFLDADDFHDAQNIAKMRDGIPLTDADRAPWLARLNVEITDRLVRGESVVLACSALKRDYRSAIASGLTRVDWLFLDGPFTVIASRMRERSATTGHYMPESLLRSQIDTLERPDDAITIPIEWSPAEQLQAAITALAGKSTC
jgi:gluconokinase